MRTRGWALALVFVLGVAACGGSDSDDSGGASDSSSPPASDDDSEDRDVPALELTGVNRAYAAGPNGQLFTAQRMDLDCPSANPETTPRRLVIGTPGGEAKPV